MKYFLSIGSNVEPAKNIPACLKLLKETFPSAKFSSVYETDPVGPAGKEKFWNLAASLEIDLAKPALLEKLRALEEKLGRRRDPQNKFAARSIDLDILPQPGWQDFGFIVVPLSEIANEKDTETGKTFGELAQKFASREGLRKIL